MAYRYRDNETGHFVSRETWETSHGPGGDYHRETIQPREREREEVDHSFEDDFMPEPDYDYDLGEDEY